MRMAHGLVGLALIAACTARPDVGTERESMLEADRAFARATAEHGVAGWAGAFADDGVMFFGAQQVVGPDSIRALMAPVFADTSYRLEWDPGTARVSASADVGYTVGRYRSRRVANGGEIVRTGSYVTIWRKDAAGRWKVALDIGNPDPPPAGN